MSSQARYVRGNCNPKPLACDPSYPIEVGDLLFREPSNGLARPASAMAGQGSETLNQQTFHDVFLGVALQKNGVQPAPGGGSPYTQPAETWPIGSTGNHSPANVIEVATTGTFVFPLSSAASYNGGEFIGPAGATTLANQQVKTAAAGAAGSIGRASPSAAAIGQQAQQLGTAIPPVLVNYVEVEIESTIFYGGEQSYVVGSSSGTP
jgi:hypothetical protein